MPLLDIKVTKHVTITSKIEDSTAKMVDLYAEFASASADAVVNASLVYSFKHDKQFQKYLAGRGDVKAEPSLKVKKDPAAPKKIKGPRKQPIAIAQ